MQNIGQDRENMTQDQKDKEQEVTRSRNTSNIQIVNKLTKEEFSVYLKNNYLYETTSGIVPCDLYQYKYRPGIIDNKPVVLRQQYYPKWFSNRSNIDFLDTKFWEIST